MQKLTCENLKDVVWIAFQRESKSILFCSAVGSCRGDEYFYVSGAPRDRKYYVGSLDKCSELIRFLSHICGAFLCVVDDENYQCWVRDDHRGEWETLQRRQAVSRALKEGEATM